MSRKKRKWDRKREKEVVWVKKVTKEKSRKRARNIGTEKDAL
jgi:hypothetical protein